MKRRPDMRKPAATTAKQGQDRSTRALLLVAAGLMGAAGLAMRALAAHLAQDPAHARWLGEAGLVLLMHAPLALALAGGGRWPPLVRWGGLAALAGALVFGLSLAAQAALGLGPGQFVSRLTPLGGAGAIAGWLLIAAGGIRLWRDRRPSDDQTRP